MTNGQGEDDELSAGEVLEGLVDTIEGQQAAITELQATLARRNGPISTSQLPRPRRGQPLANARLTRRRAWWNREALAPVAREELDREVHSWGDWLRSVYRIQQLPSTWSEDAALHAEVLALYASWRAAYRNPAASPEQPGNWHEALARFISRIEAYHVRAGRNLVGAVDQTAPPESGPRFRASQAVLNRIPGGYLSSPGRSRGGSSRPRS